MTSESFLNTEELVCPRSPRFKYPFSYLRPRTLQETHAPAAWLGASASIESEKLQTIEKVGKKEKNPQQKKPKISMIKFLTNKVKEHS